MLPFALILSTFSVGNIIGLQTFQARDAPGYVPAQEYCLGNAGCGGGECGDAVWYYVWLKRRKDKATPASKVVEIGGQSEPKCLEGKEPQFLEDRIDK